MSESDVRNVFLKNDVVCCKTLNGNNQLIIVASNVPKTVFSKRQTLVGHALKHLTKRKYAIDLSERISVLEEFILRDSSGDYVVFSSKPIKLTGNVTLLDEFLENLPFSMYRDSIR